MSGPYTELTSPFGFKKFVCNLCGYETFTKQGAWDHLDKKHPEVNLQEVV